MIMENIKEIKFHSSKYRVVALQRKSKARYAESVKVNDVLNFDFSLRRTSGASNGNYSLDILMYVNGEFLASLSQNELPKLWEDIFILEEI